MVAYLGPKNYDDLCAADTATRFQPGSTTRSTSDGSRCRVSGAAVDAVRVVTKAGASRSADAVLVVDGGDFVATASNVVRLRAPMSWLDPRAVRHDWVAL